ncbi:MAG: hypothetical protein GXY21_10995 [Clostridiaceae bacterium]|nr:hypothetical protein [Clostridiaceae bacterium]
MIKATETTCSRYRCVRLYELRNVRCSTPKRLDVFKPNECVLECIGYRIHKNPLDGFICYQLGSQLSNSSRTNA